MNYIFVDFEMHPVDNINKEAKKLWKREIIEFGAVMLDENLNEIASFKSYVRPLFSNRIRQKYCDLTGITSEVVKYADDFKTVLERFATWCRCNGEDFTVFAWSDNDLAQINGELRQKRIIPSENVKALINSWQDFQVEYCEKMELDRLVSLEKALNALGESFDGSIHDALWDSRNTSKLYRIVKDDAALEEHKALVKNLLGKTETTSYSLGDIFDFSKIVVAA